jgi:hypothetical protein
VSDTPRTDEVEFYAGDLDGGQEAVPADFARQLEREIQTALDLNNTNVDIATSLFSKERGEWAAERKDLRDALATLVGIEEADYAPWFIEPGSELGLALAAAKKALLIWRTSE